MGNQAPDGLRFTPVELLAVRLIELHLVSSNATKTGDGLAHADEIQQAVRELAVIADRSDVKDALSSGTMPARALAALELVGPDVREGAVPFIGLEAFTVATPGDNAKWVVDRLTILHASLQRIGSTEATLEAIRHYRKSVKRLASATVSPALRLTLVGGTVVLTAASGGIATAAGTFIGTTFMSLSGAAATSAGLAFLGGGSLAAGGFGMAGGTLLVATAAKTGYAGARMLAVHMARESAAALVVELAKLDVTASLMPEMVAPTLRALHDLDAELESSPTSKEVTKSQRAVKGEIHHLTDSRPQGIARKIHGFVPLPGVDRLIDGLG